LNTVLTLATDYSEWYVIRAFPAAVLLFLCSVATALILAKQKPKGAWLAVCLVGVFYPVVQVSLAGIAGGPGCPYWRLALGPTLITATLLWAASRSWIPVAGCAAGVVVTAYQSDAWWRDNAEWWISVPWNVAVMVGLVWWAVLARRAIRPEGHCVTCGYDLRGTVGSVCPECGGGGAVGAEKPAR